MPKKGGKKGEASKKTAQQAGVSEDQEEAIARKLDFMDLVHTTATARHEAVQDSGNMLSGMLDMLKGLPKHKRDKYESVMMEEHRAELEASKRVEEAFSMLRLQLAAGIPRPVSYEDSDQTPLTGLEAKILKHMWAGGMDYSPHAKGTHLSDWCVTLWRGDYNKMMTFIQGIQGEELTQQLEIRESYMHMSSIFHVIQGARTLTSPHPQFQEIQRQHRGLTGDHMACLNKLIDLGVKIDTHDFAGYTPLVHCMTRYGTEYTLKLAKILLEKGANANSRMRFGSVALHECVAHKMTDAIALLVKYNADPQIPDMDGVTPQDMNRAPEISRLFAKATSKQCKEMRNVAKMTGYKDCVVCAISQDTKRCAACFLVYYCGSECQRGDWTNHKGQCKQTQNEFIPVKLSKKEQTLYNYKTGQVSGGATKANSIKGVKFFPIKVQMPLGAGSDVSKIPELLIYNQARDISGSIFNPNRGNNNNHKKQDLVFDVLGSKILTKGATKEKGFFPATFNKQDGLKINPYVVLPPESW